jgi:hypothetical protein
MEVTKDMEGYLNEKNKIIIDHSKRLVETNNQILIEMRKALEDDKTSAEVKLSIAEWLKIGEFSFDRESSTGMNSEDKLALAKLYFENTKMMVDSLKESNNSYLKNIDELLEMTREDIRIIDEQIKNTEDQEKIASLKEEKNRKIAKY